MKLRTPYSLNEIGQRANQEDSIFPSKGAATEESRLFLVCDGMGGHENGEVASGLVCSTFGQTLNSIDHDNFTTDMFVETLSLAYDALDREDPNPESTRKMGTTLTFLQIGRNEVTVAHMGDSRVYHVRPNSVNPIVYKSCDHSLVNELVRAEIITPEEALTHPRRNVITRAMQPNLEVRHKADVRVFQDVQDGDYFFLCSDGVLETITDDILVEVLSRSVSDAEKIEAIREMCQANSRDNFSAYLVPVAEGTGFVAPIVEPCVHVAQEVKMVDMVDPMPCCAAPQYKSSPAQEIEEVKVPKRKFWIIPAIVVVAVVVGAGFFKLFVHNAPDDASEECAIAATITDDSNTDDNWNNMLIGTDDQESPEKPEVEEPEVEPIPTTEQPSQAVLRLVSDNSITVRHSGGNGTIRYALENPISDVNISVSDDANWLTTIVTDSVIAYTAQVNNSESSRTATITASYDDQSFEVTIAQNGKPAPAPAPTPAPAPVTTPISEVEHGEPKPASVTTQSVIESTSEGATSKTRVDATDDDESDADDDE